MGCLMPLAVLDKGTALRDVSDIQSATCALLRGDQPPVTALFFHEESAKQSPHLENEEFIQSESSKKRIAYRSQGAKEAKSVASNYLQSRVHT